MTRFRTIVADPPWPLQWGARRVDGKMPFGSRRGTLPYSTLSMEQLMVLPVAELAAHDAHLYVWTVNAFLEETYALVRAWDFVPSTLLVWAKSPKGRGLGGTFSISTEYILSARRGKLTATGRIPRNWWTWPRGPHSSKPDAFLDLVEQVSPGPYLEMFARRGRLGWDYWGDESLGTVSLPEKAA